MSPRHLRRLAPLVALVLLGPAACSRESREAAPARSGAASEVKGQVVAEVGDEPITLGELEEWLKNDLMERETAGKSASELYQLHADGLDRMLNQRLLEAEAQRQGVTAEQTLRSGAQPVPVTEEDVRKFFDENQQRLPDTEFDQIAPRIRGFLEQQNEREASVAYLQGLRERANVAVHLEPPRTVVAATGPSQGPADAPITIVEFSDYQCPFCRRAHPNVMEVLSRFPTQVRLVYRHFPLDSIHPRARPAAEAAACADDQGRFWDYHEKLFSGGTDLSETSLKAYAKELGLDVEAFDRCVAERKFKDLVEADLQAGQQASVSGTPAFFVNGIQLSGARPVEDFVRLIEQELARAEAPQEG